jgi:hypothetical protein
VIRGDLISLLDNDDNNVPVASEGFVSFPNRFTD